MIKINVTKQSNYPVDTHKLKRRLKDFLIEKGISSETEVEVAVVGEKKMREITKSYIGTSDKELHSVLSFTATESKKTFIQPPDGIIRLGEIILCYPKIFEEAKKEGKLIDEKAGELIEHGALHLMGIHHK